MRCSNSVGLQVDQSIYKSACGFIHEGILVMAALRSGSKSGQFVGVRVLQAIGRALDARDTYRELSVLNDVELAKRGLHRNDIVKQAMEKLG